MVKTVYWFRKALRLHDNPALVKAIQGSSHVHPVPPQKPHLSSLISHLSTLKPKRVLNPSTLNPKP